MKQSLLEGLMAELKEANEEARKANVEMEALLPLVAKAYHRAHIAYNHAKAVLNTIESYAEVHEEKLVAPVQPRGILSRLACYN